MANSGVKNDTIIPSVPLRVYYRKMPKKIEYNIPQELIIEILKWLPVVSLLRFMYVSKSWHSLITSPTFVSIHLSCQSDQTNKNSILTLFRAASRFFMHRLHEPINEWTKINSPLESVGVIVGCCHGVVCLFDYLPNICGPLILWNPSIRKTLTRPLNVPATNKLHLSRINSAFPNFTLGFGFDLVSKDYKVVRVSYNWVEESNTTHLHSDICCLNKSGWTKGGSLVEDGKSILEWGGVYVNGVIHWICTRKHGSTIVSKTVRTFDLANGIFNEIQLPLYVPSHSIAVLMSVKMAEDKLAVSSTDSGGNVLEHNYNNSGCNIWVMMEYGNPKSWRRLINVYLGDSLGKIRGALITGDGKTVVATSAGNLVSWDSNNDMIENIALPILEPQFMTVYVPSLVLLRCNNRDWTAVELPLKKKKKRGNRMGDGVQEHPSTTRANT